METPLRLAPVLRKIFFATCVCSLASSGFAEKPVAGLSVTYSMGGNSAAETAENVRLYVSENQTPSPFLAAGKFTAVWNGFLSADLRGDYAFQAELNGALTLEINGVSVLEVVGTNSASPFSKPIRLSKGTNLFTAKFSSPTANDAFVRLSWKRKGRLPEVISSAAFSHFVTRDEERGQKLLRGRELFVEHRCAKCHAIAEAGIPELAMDAPSFQDIGSRRNSGWMAQWIENPRAMRVSARMPRMFHGVDAKENSEAVAAFLGSLNKKNEEPRERKFTSEMADKGKSLFDKLHCAACHDVPYSSENDVGKISLKNVREKFPDDALVQFLKQPDLHYTWTRMPRFKLADEQRQQLAAFLISDVEISPRKTGPTQAMIARGKELVQSSGCLNCHSLELENPFTTKTLAEISDWKSGCLAEKPLENSNAPQFGFSTEELGALREFARTDHASLTRHIPAEFAQRESKNMNCIECHNKIEGVPRFEILGGKLKPEWSAKFLSGEIAYKPRPWVEAQMPALPKRAHLLAEGLAMQHGIAPHTAVEPTPDPEAVEAGRKLVSSPPLGFSCVSCHAVGEVGATQVFESPGINLARSGERLLPDFFKRWMLSPSSINPITKMPTYFDEEGNSPLTDVADGNGTKQIEAIWQYIRLGEKMPAPAIE